MVIGVLGFLLFTLVPLAVLVVVISRLAAAHREADLVDGEPDEGIGTVRRLFIYALALVGLVFAGVGIAMVIAGALDAVAGRVLIADRRQGMAVALAFTVVGTPAWLFFAWLAQRSLREHEVERRSQVRRLYLGLARGIAVAVVAANAISAGRMVAGIDPFRGDPWGALVAWAAVWFLHQRLASAEPATTAMTRLLDRLTAYFGALLGLGLLVGGVVGTIAAPLSEAYDRAFGESLISTDWTEPLRSALVVSLVGAALWGWYWLHGLLRTDRLTTLWRIEVILFGVLLGTILAVTPAGLLLYAVLEWFFGQPQSDTAVAQFAGAPESLAMLIVGLAAWGYHRAVLEEAGAGHDRGGPERVYRYVLAATGLAVTATGVATFIALAADALGTPSAELVRGSEWWRNPLVRAITLTVVGLPLWLRYWVETQRVVAGNPDERAAESRRIYVFAIVGVATLALLASLTVLLYQVFRAVLDADMGWALLRDLRWALAVAATAGSIAWYHFLVLREDQAALPHREVAAEVRAREVILVTAGRGWELLAEIEQIPGVHARAWRRVDGGNEPALDPEQRVALASAVAASTAGWVLVTVSGHSFEVIPFTRDAGPIPTDSGRAD